MSPSCAAVHEQLAYLIELSRVRHRSRSPAAPPTICGSGGCARWVTWSSCARAAAIQRPAGGGAAQPGFTGWIWPVKVARAGANAGVGGPPQPRTVRPFLRGPRSLSPRPVARRGRRGTRGLRGLGGHRRAPSPRSRARDPARLKTPWFPRSCLKRPRLLGARPRWSRGLRRTQA
jgi:hypothetical protein